MTQWECLLQNLGDWQGSFTRFSPEGELIEDIPTVVSLHGLNNNQTIRQIIRRCPRDQPVEEKILEYSSLGRGVLFFENGAFSQGSIQLSPFGEFGAELGLIAGDRRLRLVQLFEDRKLTKITLIREIADTTTSEPRQSSPAAAIDNKLKVEDLLGDWQGEAITIYPDRRSPDTYPVQLQVAKSGASQITQQLTISQGNSIQVNSKARIEGSLLYFDEGSQPNQVLLLPDGASATCPQEVKSGQAFFLEAGWLLQPNLRQRLIRRYDDKGGWSSLTLVTERKLQF